VPNDLGLRGEIFTDVGSLWGTTKTIAATPGVQGSALAPRASVGVGLLWESPIGNLEAGYAIAVVKQSYDKAQPLYFGLVPFLAGKWPRPRNAFKEAVDLRMVPLLALIQAGPADAAAHRKTSEIGMRANPLAASGYTGYYAERLSAMGERVLGMIALEAWRFFRHPQLGQYQLGGRRHGIGIGEMRLTMEHRGASATANWRPARDRSAQCA
jgi:hypothetical protein